MLGLRDHVCALLKGPASLLGADPTHQHMLGCNSCAAKLRQNGYEIVHYSAFVMSPLCCRGIGQGNGQSHVKCRSQQYYKDFVRIPTWGASNDVYTLLQCPTGLLGVGTTDKQFTAQLWLREVLLEAVHEVVGLLG